MKLSDRHRFPGTSGTFALILRTAALCLCLSVGSVRAAPPAKPVEGSQAAIALLTNGLSRDAVIELVGPPAGNLLRDELEILYYGDQGSITLNSNRVSAFRMITEEEARRLTEQRAREEARREAAERAARAKRIAEGDAEKARFLANPNLASMSADEKLAFWRQFTKKYPETPASTELAGAEDEVGMAEKAALLSQNLPPAERLAKWQAFAANYPRIPVDAEIQKAQAESTGTDGKSISEKITALEAAAKDAEIRSHWSGKWTHRKAIREYQGLTNEIAKLKEQQGSAPAEPAPTEQAPSAQAEQ